jgi:hypothetical protein
MTRPTNSRGETVLADAADADCGPYLKCIPVNPYKGANDVKGDRDGGSAWYYNEKTGEFRPNHGGAR